MFNNVSNKLKLVAKIYFWVVVAISVLLACTIGIGHGMHRSGISLNILFPLFLIIGPACGYLNALMITGFGEIVANTSKSECNENQNIEVKVKKTTKKNKKEDVVVEDQTEKETETKEVEE